MKRTLIVLAVVTGLVACKKEYDSPPIQSLNSSKVVTIDSLRAWQQAETTVSIQDSLSLYAIVTMDESEGNIYKNLFIEDHTGGLNLRLTSSSDYKVGDSVRISLHGAYLNAYAGVVQLDSIDPDVMIIRQSSNNIFTAADITVDSLLAIQGNESWFRNWEGRLVRINNVQFATSELSLTYADAVNQFSQDRILADCNGNQIIVRSSGFADFAGDQLAQGNGSITCIVGRYNETLQLIIRDSKEINMAGDRCAGEILFKDFEDEILTSGGWQNVSVSGAGVQWIVDYFGGNNFGKCTNYDQGTSSNTACETWLISPAIDLSGSASASMSFMNDVNYSGDPLKLMVSTNYTGSGDPNLATWDDISSLVSWDPATSGWGFHDSGNIDLSSYVGNTIYIGFRYTGTNSNGSTWEIDDISIIG